MNDFYTFIVCSTINASIGTIENEKRFQETLGTLDSIRRKVDNAIIIFVDNSINPLADEQKSELESKAEFCEYLEPSLFTVFANGVGSKGLGEASLVFHALTKIEQLSLVGKRIFKMAARYRLADGFDIREYNDPKFNGKYAFRINDWDVSVDNFTTHRETVTYFETRLFSFCSSLFYDYADIIKQCFYTMIEEFGKPMCNWERCHYLYIPHDKTISMNPIHVEGFNAENGVHRTE